MPPLGFLFVREPSKGPEAFTASGPLYPIVPRLSSQAEPPLCIRWFRVVDSRSARSRRSAGPWVPFPVPRRLRRALPGSRPLVPACPALSPADIHILPLPLASVKRTFALWCDLSGAGKGPKQGFVGVLGPHGVVLRGMRPGGNVGKGKPPRRGARPGWLPAGLNRPVPGFLYGKAWC